VRALQIAEQGYVWNGIKERTFILKPVKVKKEIRGFRGLRDPQGPQDPQGQQDREG